eukprot:CAMPEP_0179131526 /NCGR_PEP_ID=MMETSP0796-20121207/62483_1 /TAXON_ID=73915 /ORGANISM="Pyrodinium bahamense, Strain pbaha01" /LENGTH=95 /DNA_ID=CAMNT_0020830455 /DNA_START=268 /DNA_END=555 /DNA_ORIENTATION=-
MAAIACAAALLLESSSSSPTRNWALVPPATAQRCSAKPPKGRVSAASRNNGEAAMPRWKRRFMLRLCDHAESRAARQVAHRARAAKVIPANTAGV